MSYRVSIPLGMLFRKMKCSQCGSKLKRKKVTSKDNRFAVRELGVQPILGGKWYLGKNHHSCIYVYHCPVCGAVTDYDEQLKISKLQRQFGKTIL